MPSRFPLSRWCPPHARHSAPTGWAGGKARLLSLVRRTADRDRDAFADLYDRLSEPVLRAVRATVPDPAAAATIATATMMEVWWMARFHTGAETDVHVWLGDIVGRRSGDWVAGRGLPALGAAYDGHTSLALAEVLGRRAAR